MRIPVLIGSCLLLLNLPLQSASAANSIWDNQPTAFASKLGDYRKTACNTLPPKPYTGHLRLESKYDQNDSSRSTLSHARSDESQQISEHIQGYYVGLVRLAANYHQARTPEQARESLSCMDVWLESWARAGALQSTDVTGTGQAMRKWALAAISSTILKTQSTTGQRFKPSSIQRNWLDRLAGMVISDYQPRLDPQFRNFNNHDYWAAWAVAATGLVLNRDRYVTWSDQALRRGISQIVISKRGDYGYLPQETARGSLAADYTHYALVPLVLLAESAHRNGRTLKREERERMELLANFAARAVLEPAKLPELARGQAPVPQHKMAWLMPFLEHRPNHPLARKLYESRFGEVDHYSQIGGTIKFFYSKL